MTPSASATTAAEAPGKKPVHYWIEHVTAYDYSQNVSISHHVARLRPISIPGQKLKQFQIVCDPVPALLDSDTDYFGNVVDRFSIQEPHDRLEVIARSEVEVAHGEQEIDGAGPAWENVVERLREDRSPAGLKAQEFTFPSDFVTTGPEYADYAAASFPEGRPLFEAVMDLTVRIHEDFTFDPTATTVSTPVSEVFSRRRGVCQDFAHFQIACLRSLGLPACYVSGYVRTEPPAGQERLVGADATHAWVSVFGPGTGWIEFDPTNRCVAGSTHVRVAFGRDFSDVSPLRGTVIGGGWQKLSIGVTVRPSDEAKPKSSEKAILPE